MSVLYKFNEKATKLYKYIKLEYMFRKRSEFRTVHPELISLWKEKFRQMIRYSSDRTFPIAEEFLTVNIIKVKDSEMWNRDINLPIVICAVKDDLPKMRLFMEHYRKIGIENFVLLDNASTDGTYEFLLLQKDAVLFRCEHPFTADRKIAWMNRLIAEMGDDKWYLMVDSDELVTYIDGSKYTINDMIQKCQQRGYKRMGAVMLDMYPQRSLFEAANESDIINHYCYMDADTYMCSQASNGITIFGGPRKRVFGTKNKLSKYCLFYFEKDDIVASAHFLIPFEKGLDVPVGIAILHYKFVNESDYEKVIEAVQTGAHSDNSREYKTYYQGMKQDHNISFYCEEHSVYYNDENLRKINILEDIWSD